ncbi:MAG: molybdate ABC transporter permease subunit, partial [Crocosphaera sp.]
MTLDFSPIWISLKTAALATVIAFFLGSIAARTMFKYRGKGKGLIDGILTAPLVLPPTVVGFFLLLLLGKYGPIGRLLRLVDVRIIFTWYAAVIAATVVAFPLMYKTALGAFQQIDRNLLSSARTLGATEWQVFWRVLLPLARPGLISGVLLAFARALGEFGATLMLAGSIPGRTQTIPIAIFFAAESGDMGEALLWVSVMLGLSLTIVVGVNYWNDNRPQKRIRKRAKEAHLTLVDESLLPWDHPVTPLTWEYNSTNILPNPIELIVDIQKKLPGFTLNVSFSSNQLPLGLLGGSGAGKSFILRCIAGLETPDNGCIILNGRVLFDSRRGINVPIRDRRVGFLFQNYALFPHLTVAQNIAFGLPKTLSSLAIRQRVESQLMAVQLQGLGDRYPQELSGGQQQRVALARALASEPDILLLDEPFSALDTYLRDQLEKLLRLSLIHFPGATLFVSHNLEEAYRICP